MDNHTFGDEVAFLMKLLQAHEPRQIGKQIFTSEYVMCYFVTIQMNMLSGLQRVYVSPHTNVLVGRDGAAMSNKCFAQYVQSWGPPEVCQAIRKCIQIMLTHDVYASAFVLCE